MKIEKFQDLECWKLSRELVVKIYRLSKRENFANDFDLMRQIRRASVSVMSNIAEGFCRRGDKEFRNFLHISAVSCGEVLSQLYVAMDLEYISKKLFLEMYGLVSRVNGTIFGLIKYLNQSNK